MVVVPKPNGSVRITTDFSHLNKAIKREKLELPSVDYVLGQLAGAKYFSKLDANSWFYQCQLAEESAPLTTFITPVGRFCYNRLPMGISSAPEFFSRKMNNILDGCQGALNLMDDICVFGSTLEEHDVRLRRVFQILSENNVTLNPEKCEFGVTSMKYLGYWVDGTGIHPEKEKQNAIVNFPQPKNTTEVRRWLGMINQLAKFVPNLSSLTKPLRDLLNKDCHWIWEDAQEKSFQSLKKLLLSAEVLGHYDPNKDIKIFADSSQHGLGSVLCQDFGGNWRPVSYASRSLTQTEMRYATIEKEALALTWACERFHQYIFGRTFILCTDHNPLVSLLGHKRIDELPLRIQRFRILLMNFNYTIMYVPGK